MSACQTQQRPSVADRVFAILEACAASAGPLSLTDIAACTGLPKTTVHRVCWKLVDLNVLDQTTAGFQVGTKLFALGCMSPRLRLLRSTGMDYLQALATQTGWVSAMAVMSGEQALVIEQVSGDPEPRRRLVAGNKMPLHATALGKALLAGQGAETLSALPRGGLLQPYTRNTIVRPGLLYEHLREIRRTGVAYANEEWRMGTSSVAAPITVNGETIASLGLMGMPGPATLRRLAHPVQRVANRLGIALTLAMREAAGQVMLQDGLPGRVDQLAPFGPGGGPSDVPVPGSVVSVERPARQSAA